MQTEPPSDDGSPRPENSPARVRPMILLDRLPPGIVLDQYAIDDLRVARETGDENDIVTRYVAVWTTLRDVVIDLWLDTERILRTACVLLLSPTPQLQARVWDLMRRQGGDALIDLTADLLEAKGHALPEQFKPDLKRLVKLRNLLAHQPSRPRENISADGLVFFRSTGFRTGEYVEVTYEEIDDVRRRAKPMTEWLTSEIPEADGFSVQFVTDPFDAVDEEE